MASNNNDASALNAGPPPTASVSTSAELLYKKPEPEMESCPSSGDLCIDFDGSTTEIDSCNDSPDSDSNPTQLKKKKTPPAMTMGRGPRPATGTQSDVTLLTNSLAMTDIIGREKEVANEGRDKFVDIPMQLSSSYTSTPSNLSLGPANSNESMSTQFPDDGAYGDEDEL